jgi:hypothetical protein
VQGCNRPNRLHARGIRPIRHHPARLSPPPLPETDAVTNILVTVFAVTLCLINALVWTFVSDLPLMGACWVLASALCVKLEKWSRR